MVLRYVVYCTNTKGKRSVWVDTIDEYTSNELAQMFQKYHKRYRFEVKAEELD